MVKVTLPNGTVTTLEYDDLGRLTALVNAKGEAPGNAVITSYAYRYDDDAINSGLGLVDRITHEDGRFDTFSYDAHERLTAEHYKTPQDATLFRFDYTYDDDGNRYRKEYRDDDSLRVYYSDATGATSDGEDEELGPSNRVARAWTRTGETGPTKMGDKINVTGSFTEENVASIAVEANDSGTPTYATWREDGFWIARGIELDDSDENTLEATVTDKAGNSATYPVSPATHETKLDENLNVVYEYDAVGNVQKKTEVVAYDNLSPSTTTYVTRYFYDDANRLEYIDYNWTTATLRVAWTKLSLRRVSRLGGDVHYVYDPIGQRVEIRYGQITLSGEDFSSFSPAAGAARGFVCMGGSIIEEWTVSDGGTGSHTDDSLNTLAYCYVRNPATDLGGGIGSIIYQIDGSDYRYYHYNHKGDVGALSEADTDICAWYEYDAWGNVVTEWEASGVENEFRFSTKQWDPTPPDANGTAPDAGLIYFGARYLDPDLGRWTQMDPAGTVDGLNAYIFAEDNPTFALDPMGFEIKTISHWRQDTWPTLSTRTENAFRGAVNWAFGTHYGKVYGYGHYLKVWGDTEDDCNFIAYGTDSAKGKWSFAPLGTNMFIEVEGPIETERTGEDGARIQCVTYSSEYKTSIGIEFKGADLAMDMTSSTISITICADGFVRDDMDREE